MFWLTTRFGPVYGKGFPSSVTHGDDTEVIDPCTAANDISPSPSRKQVSLGYAFQEIAILKVLRSSEI